MGGCDTIAFCKNRAQITNAFCEYSKGSDVQKCGSELTNRDHSVAFPLHFRNELIHEFVTRFKQALRFGGEERNGFEFFVGRRKLSLARRKLIELEHVSEHICNVLS